MAQAQSEKTKSGERTASSSRGREEIPTIVVIGAMDEEVKLLAQHLQSVRQLDEAGLHVLVGTLETNRGRTLRIAATVAGMGTVAAGAATQFMITTFHPRAVLFSGIAGNLTDTLDINDVVLGGTLRYLDTDMRLIDQAAPKLDEYHSDPNLVRMAEQALDEQGIRYKVGIIASGNHFIDTEEKREEVRRQTDADAAEMEGAAIGQISMKNGVPFLVIRALSDNTNTQYESFRHFDISEYADTASALVLAILKRM